MSGFAPFDPLATSWIANAAVGVQVVQHVRATLALRVEPLAHDPLVLEIAPDVDLAVVTGVAVLGADLLVRVEPLLQVHAAAALRILLEPRELARLEPRREIGLAVAGAVLVLAQHGARGVGRDPGVGGSVAVGIRLLHLRAACAGRALAVHPAVEIRVLLLAIDLAVAVGGDHVGAPVAVAILLGSHEDTVLVEVQRVERSVAARVLLDPGRPLLRVEERHDVVLAVVVAILALLRFRARPVGDEHVRHAVAVLVGLRARARVARVLGGELEPPVEIPVGLLARERAVLVDLDEVGLGVGVRVDLLAQRLLLRVEDTRGRRASRRRWCRAPGAPARRPLNVTTRVELSAALGVALLGHRYAALERR